jgi:hypothetical protein
MTSWVAPEMYRDDPLDDEAELRGLVGDEAVDALVAVGGSEGLLGALDALRILQGWVDDDAARTWLTTQQRRLADRTPLAALAAGDVEDVDDVLRAYVAAQS